MLQTLLATLAAASAQMPNIVFVMADDLGWSDLGFAVADDMPGSDFYETPNIKRFAREGLAFTRAYAAGANSAPSRACLMSGLYAPRHGIYTVSPSARGDSTLRRLVPVDNTDDLSPRFPTIAEALSARGYDCASIGKWHLGQDGEGTGPTDRGFRVNVAGSRAGSPTTYWHDGDYLTDSLHRAAMRFIGDHAKADSPPFFLYLSHYAVHVPLQAPDSLVAKYRRKRKGTLHSNPRYAAMIESVDHSFGEICRAIDSLGMADRTLIVFCSDNGGMEPTTDNHPLRGGKGEPYEGGIRVPLIMRWPHHLPEGETTDLPVSGIDFFPTFVALAGGTPSSSLDGQPIFTVVENHDAPAAEKSPNEKDVAIALLTPDNRDDNDAAASISREKASETIVGFARSFKLLPRRDRPLFWHFPAYLQAYRGDGFRATPYSMVVCGDWKLIRQYETATEELYNLRTDPSEQRNLLKSERRVAHRLRRLLNRWLRETKAPIPAPKSR